VPSHHRGMEEVLRSGVGPQLATHATAIRAGGKADTRAMRTALLEDPPLPQTSLFMRDVQRHPTFVARKRGPVRDLFDEWLALFPRDPRRLPEGDERTSIVELVAEAATNILDHSDKQPWTEERPYSYVQLRWRTLGELQPPPEGFSGEDQSSRYLGTLLDKGSDLGSLGGLLEIAVVDDGVGIAPRFALDHTVVEQDDPANERENFAAALAAGGTVKLRAKDCPVEMNPPGFGSEKILAAIRDLFGYVSIRSGRLVAYASATDGLDDGAGFTIEPAVRPLISGTILHILVPVFSQPRPHPISDDPQRLF
jgi:hypothetical protein